MIDSILSVLAPHLCSGCQKVGSYLCDSCKHNIISEPFYGCVACGRLTGLNGICSTCRVPYQRAWCVSERTEELLELIDAYKFERAKSAHAPLAALLAGRLPQLPQNIVVVPIPTIASHIRQRGYDHTLLVARRLAYLKGLKMQRVLERASTTKQRGAGRQLRTRQAREAFRLAKPIALDVPYLLVDDIVTTGATLKYAAKLLRDAGVKDVWVAVLARQTWTKDT